MSAARSPRVICGRRAIARYSAGSRASSARARSASSTRAWRSRRSASMASASSYAFDRALEVAPRLEQLANLPPASAASAGSRSTARAEVLRAPVGDRLAAARRRPARGTETRYRASSQSRPVRADRVVDAGRRRAACRAHRQVAARRRGTSAPRRAGAICVKRRDRPRARLRMRRAPRPRVVERQAAPRPGRPAPRGPPRCRASARSKCSSAAFASRSRELQIAEADLGRIERRGRLERQSRTPARRFFRSPAWRNCQPRSWLRGGRRADSAAGPAGAMKSGNRGDVTTGSGAPSARRPRPRSRRTTTPGSRKRRSAFRKVYL